MAEVTQDAYIALRTYITSNWKTVSLRNDTNREIKRLTYDSSKVKWTHTKTTEQVQTGVNDFDEPIYDYVEVESNQTLELTITLAGADFSLPATISKSVILNSNNKEISVESFQPFTFENAGDQLTIKHKIQVPAIA
ncbi:hypothetical protein AN964_11525 [Heyndrickxia shackletonii]|uniref:Uncharacterized protein n=1 Tax=Heyndrickxia shackletonii TaxID=157838 RepID=A0A0Q3TJD3_9BACI|nr:hypothetical protein [Heyndrickxia shackletonii]KQL54064.1 hypothetical protein AN964_11525 [Heyndrickxia shackletonii]NEY99389.1 hypothetical protein [Heyndrickxia shackletonii]